MIKYFILWFGFFSLVLTTKAIEKKPTIQLQLIPSIVHSFLKTTELLAEKEADKTLFDDLTFFSELESEDTSCENLPTQFEKANLRARNYSYTMNPIKDCKKEQETLREDARLIQISIIKKIWEKTPTQHRHDFENIYSQIIYPLYNFVLKKSAVNLLEEKIVEWNVSWNIFYMKYAKGHKEIPLAALRELAATHDKWSGLVRTYYK